MRAIRVAPVLLALALAAGLAPPAVAAPPAERTITDPVDGGSAYDVVSVRMLAARAPGRKARLVIEHARRVATGDAVDVWLDTDDDRVPDLFLTGVSFSEYAVYKARSWTQHGRDISDRGCASLTMAGRRSVVRFDPACVAPSTRFAASVRSYRQGEPARTDDYAPRRHRLSKRVLSYRP